MDIYSIIILLLSAIGLIATTARAYDLPIFAFASRPGYYPELPIRALKRGTNSLTSVSQTAYALLILGTLLFAKGWLAFWPVATIIAMGFTFSLYFLSTKRELGVQHTLQTMSTLNFGLIALSAYFVA